MKVQFIEIYYFQSLNIGSKALITIYLVFPYFIIYLIFFLDNWTLQETTISENIKTVQVNDFIDTTLTFISTD